MKVSLAICLSVISILLALSFGGAYAEKVNTTMSMPMDVGSLAKKANPTDMNTTTPMSMMMPMMMNMTKTMDMMMPMEMPMKDPKNSACGLTSVIIKNVTINLIVVQNLTENVNVVGHKCINNVSKEKAISLDTSKTAKPKAN
jgi:hypothetical protein